MINKTHGSEARKDKVIQQWKEALLGSKAWYGTNPTPKTYTHPDHPLDGSNSFLKKRYLGNLGVRWWENV